MFMGIVQWFDQESDIVRGTLNLSTSILLVHACMLFCHRTFQHDADFAVDIMTKLRCRVPDCLLPDRAI